MSSNIDGSSDAQPSKAMHALNVLGTSPYARFALGFAIVVAFTLVVRPAVPVAIALLIASIIYIATFNREAPIGSVLQSGFLAAAPYLLFFVLAALVAFPTAFKAGAHASALLKIILLQVVVVVFYCVGRLVGRVNMVVLMVWVFGVLAVVTLVLLEEQVWSLIRDAVFSKDQVTMHETWILNRGFLLLSIGLAFFFAAGQDGKTYWMSGSAAVLMIAVFSVTESESARLAIVLAALVFLMTERMARCLLTVSVVVAIIAMLVGPFLYDLALKTWEASEFRSFMSGTIHARLMIWANFSALILDSDFLGRGLQSSKLLDRDPSLFAIPYAFSALHPHNAGLQVTADLGVLGIAWFSAVLWRIRTYVLGLSTYCMRGLVAALVAFLAISFVADGFWQSRWWFAASILALWIGILSSNSGTNAQDPANPTMSSAP